MRYKAFEFKMRKFAEEQGHEPLYRNRNKNEKTVRKTLQQCKETIAALLQSNSDLECRLRQKEAIIHKWLENKQQNLLLSANCETHLQRIKAAEDSEQNLRLALKQMQGKYDQILQNYRKEVQRLSSYNRALKIDNASLREYKQLHCESKRKNGAISQSTGKYTERDTVRENEDKVEELMGREFPVNLQMPAKIQLYEKAKDFSSTQGSLKVFHSTDLSSNFAKMPKKLFKNEMLIEVAPFERSRPRITTNVFVNNKLMSIERVIRRVKKLLQDSQEE